jgi:hypothetical protein
VKGVRAGALVWHLGRRPADAVVVARAGWRLRRKEWFRHWPFLPVPDTAYWRFRMVTVSGETGGALGPSAVVAAARWAAAQPIGRS